MSPSRFPRDVPPGLSRRSFLGALGILATAGLVGCGSDDSDSGGGDGDREDITYQLSWTHSVQFGGTYLAKDRGLFDQQGLNVALASGGPNVAGDANTVSGSALMNVSVADGVARSNMEGAGLLIIGAQYQKSAATILSLADAPLTTPEELVGKRIGVAGTDTPGLEAFLAINNMSAEDVQFIPSQYDPAVLTANQVDGLYCFYNDLPISLATQGIEGHSMLLADFGYNPMSQTYTVLRSSLEDDAKRNQIVRLLRGDIQGWQMYRDDPQAAADLTMEMYPDAGLTLESQQRQADVQLDLMYSDLTDQHGFGWFTDEQIQDNLRLFELLNITGMDESLWDRSILEEIYQDGPTA